MGGLLWGGTVASLALLVFNVRTAALPSTKRTQAPSGGLCAIIYNPTKIIDEASFRRHVGFELDQRGWEDALWLPTKAGDAGIAMANEARKRGADLVLVAGGDGTVRVVCAQLADSDIPVALIPAGTGNLLARNIGVPLDETDALNLAFEGTPTKIDLVRIIVDDDESSEDYFAVLAGIGFDAAMMDKTNEDLKKAVGSAAYVLSFAQEINAPPHALVAKMDHQDTLRTNATLTIIGNVSSLQGGVELIPGADPTDGLMDLLVASPEGLGGWARLAAKVFAKRAGGDQAKIVQGRRLRLEVEEPIAYQLDGDTIGELTTLDAEVAPGALTVMMPAGPRGLSGS